MKIETIEEYLKRGGVIRKVVVHEYRPKLNNYRKILEKQKHMKKVRLKRQEFASDS